MQAPSASLRRTFLTDAAPFSLDRPGIFPLASDVLRQARLWAATGAHTDRSGYQTAVSEPAGTRQAKANPKPKRSTVAQLATQQEALSKAVAGIAEQLSSLQALGGPAPAQAQEVPAPAAGSRSPLAAPVSSHLVQPPVDPRATLPELLGPPPRLRTHRLAVQGPECFGLPTGAGPGPACRRPHFHHGRSLGKSRKQSSSFETARSQSASGSRLSDGSPPPWQRGPSRTL